MAQGTQLLLWDPLPSQAPKTDLKLIYPKGNRQFLLKPLGWKFPSKGLEVNTSKIPDNRSLRRIKIRRTQNFALAENSALQQLVIQKTHAEN